MKVLFLSVGIVCVIVMLATAQTPSTVKVLGCLQGDGSEAKPWVLAGVAIPPPPAAVPAAAPAAGRGGGGARGAGAPAAEGARGGRGGGGGGGGGGRGGAGAAAPAPPQPAAPVPLVDLRLTGDMDMAPWRNMKIEVAGTLGPQAASGLRQLNVTFARSVQGVCTPK